MGRTTRLLDTGISLLEGLIEYISDPNRIRYLRDNVWETQRRIIDLEQENARLIDENEYLRRETPQRGLESFGQWKGRNP